jgi:hypothetical protein
VIASFILTSPPAMGRHILNQSLIDLYSVVVLTIIISQLTGAIRQSMKN